MPQLALNRKETLIQDLSTISDLNHIHSMMQHPEDGQHPKTDTQGVNTGSSLVSTVEICNRARNISSGQKNCFNRGLAVNMSTRRRNPEGKGITFPKVRGIRKKMFSARAIKMKSNLDSFCSGEKCSQILSSQTKDDKCTIRTSANYPRYTKERSQLRYPGLFSGFQKMRSAVLELRDSQSAETSSYGDGGFSFSSILNQVYGSQNKIPECQEINYDNLSPSAVLTEVLTSKFEVFHEQLKNSLSVTGPSTSSVYPTEKLERREGGRMMCPVSPWDSLTAYSKARFVGAVSGRRGNKVKTRDGSRNRTRRGRKRTVKDLRLLKKGVVMASAVKRKMKKKKEQKEERERKEKRELRRIMILKSVRKCRSFVEATLGEKWNEGEEKQRKEKKRKGDGFIRNRVKTGEKSFAKRGSVRKNVKSEFQLKATNSKEDPIGRKVASSIIIASCHQQTEYQLFYEKWRKQSAAPKLTSLLVLIIIPLLFAAGRWFQPRKAWKRLLQARRTFNVETTNSCSNVLTYPYRQLRISFLLLILSLETLYRLLLLKLSSSLLLLIPLAYSSRYQYLLKCRAQNYTNAKKRYRICLMVLLRRNRGFGIYRIHIVGNPIFKRSTLTTSSSSLINTVQMTTNFQQLRPQETYQLLNLYHLRIYFCQKGNPNCRNTNHNDSHVNTFDHDYYLNYRLSRVAKRSPGDTSCPEMLKINPKKALGKNSKISQGDARNKEENETYHNNGNENINKSVTFPSTRESINVTTCTVCEAYNHHHNNTHPHSHTWDKTPQGFNAEKNQLLESARCYLYLHNQHPKYNFRLNETSHKIILKITDGVLLRSCGWRCRYKLYNKKLTLYNKRNNNNDNNKNNDNNNDYDNYTNKKHIVFADVPSFPIFVTESPNSVVTVRTGREDAFDGIDTFFPSDKDRVPFRKVRFSDDNCHHFRPDWDLGLEYCDDDAKKNKPNTVLLASHDQEESNVNRTSKYYYETLAKKLRTPGNKVSHYYNSNQKEKSEEEEEEEEEEKGEKEEERKSIVLSSQQSWQIWPAEEIVTPSGADEKFNSMSSSSPTLISTTSRSLNYTKPREGMIITTTTTYERQKEKSLNNCIRGAHGIQRKRRRGSRLVIASSWKKKKRGSSFRGVRIISSRSSLGDRKPSIGRGGVPHSVVPEFRESKDSQSQATVDAKTKSFDHHTGKLSTTTTIPPEWTLSTYNQRRAKMETTSPGILKILVFGWNQLPKLDKLIHTNPLNSITYSNYNIIIDDTSEPLKATNDICTGFDTTASTQNSISASRANYNNGPLRALSLRRPLTNHQSELSSKTHTVTEYDNTSTPYTVSSQKSCSNSRSGPHCTPTCPLSPAPIHHHQHNNHHKKQQQQQQQHSTYKHNNNNNKNNINSSSYYIYYCDYIKKCISRFSAENLGRIMPNWGKTFLSMLLIFQVLGTSMLTSAVPVPKKKQLSNEMKGMSYLTSFGYVSGPSQEAKNLMSESVKIESIKRFQQFADLPVTGIFDHRTMKMMEKPRCGNPENLAAEESRGGRYKRYILSGSRWGRTNLTFRFINYTPDINFPKIRKAIYDAFLVWSSVTHLTFTEIMFDSNNGKNADIRIQFAKRYHNDEYPFDGEGIILAHAFFPGENKGGDTHFDDDEHWTVDSDDGVNLFMVAAHEFGHALGLSHSKTPGSLMYPWYQGKQSKGYKLPEDDVNGIQKLYGVKNGNETFDILVREFPDDPPFTEDDNRDDEIPHGNCTHTFDAITQIRGDVYIFKGKYFWRWTSGGLKDSKPIPISHFWYQFPEDSIDAVFERKRDSKIMFFKGDKYWLYDANHMERGWPAEGRPLVELGLPVGLKKIDAAFTWSYNKRTYLVSNDMYWKFDKMESYMVYDYPRAMKIWEGVPTPLDAAFQFTDKKTYFIKGKYYWEYEDIKMRVKSKTPTGNIAERWMQCPSQQKRRPQDNSRPYQNTLQSGSGQMTGISGLLLCTVSYFTRRLIA